MRNLTTVTLVGTLYNNDKKAMLCPLLWQAVPGCGFGAGTVVVVVVAIVVAMAIAVAEWWNVTSTFNQVHEQISGISSNFFSCNFLHLLGNIIHFTVYCLLHNLRFLHIQNMKSI